MFVLYYQVKQVRKMKIFENIKRALDWWNKVRSRIF